MFFGGAPGLVLLGDVFDLLAQTAVGIEQRTLRRGMQQRLVGMLAVDVQQQFTKFAQAGERCWRAIDVGAAAAIAYQHPA